MKVTQPIRVPVDLAEMLAVIAKNTPKKTVADIVAPLLRAHIKRLFDGLPEEDRNYALARIARATTKVTASK